MPQRFYAFESPDFNSPIITSFPPGYVLVLEHIRGTWGRINTVFGDVWIPLDPSGFFVPRTTGLHEYIGAEFYGFTLSQGYVNVLDIRGNWLLASTASGNKWINVFFQPSQSRLENAIGRHGSSVAVFYMDIESGFTFMHNADAVFSSASVNKVQHALYVYYLAERGLTDLSRMHTFTAADYRGGTGRIRHGAVGRTFSSRDLLRYSIRYSDNVAFRMLVRDYGLRGYMDFVRGIGADESLVRNITGSNITARDAGVWGLAIYEYLISGGQYSDMFRSDMINTNMTLVRADYPIASKYGWWERMFHELAIVFAPSPYILVILTDREEASAGLFVSISREIELFHRQYFGR